MSLFGRRCVFINDAQYSYNVRNELTSGQDRPYAYDDIGNRTTAEGKTYTANNLNQYIAIDDFTPEYDADGNQTLIKTETGIWSVTYNAENRPIRWQSGDTVITMAFDRMGRRVEMRTVKDGEETLQRFVYDNYLCIQQLRSTDNTLFQSYIWDPTEPIATRPLIFQPVSGEVAYYFHDGNKNVSDLVDAQGSVVHYAYTPFGSHMTSVPSGNPFRFSSEIYDVTLDVYYYNFRHYVSETNHWLSRDPLMEEGGNNLFLFSRNNPISVTDITGLWTLSFGIAWFGGGGVGVSGNFTITISYSREKGFQIGATTTNGGGSVVGAGGSVGVVISVTNAPDINSLTGASLVIGGSVGEGLIGGGEISIPTDLECGYAQISGSFGLGIGSFAEGHTHITHTRTWEWWTSRGKDVGRDE